MNHLARFYLNYSPIEIESLIGRGSRQLTMDRVPLEAIAEYGAEDADVTLRLKNLLWPQIAGTGFEKLYREIEEPLIDVLADIELTGVKIDTARLAEYGRELTVEMDALEGRIRELAGTPDLNRELLASTSARYSSRRCASTRNRNVPKPNSTAPTKSTLPRSPTAIRW